MQPWCVRVDKVNVFLIAFKFGDFLFKFTKFTKKKIAVFVLDRLFFFELFIACNKPNDLSDVIMIPSKATDFFVSLNVARVVSTIDFH